MKNIYIELSGPRSLWIATQIGDDRAQNYTIYEIEYGRDLISRFEDSKAFNIIALGDLPDDILNDFDFKRRMISSFERAFVHIED
jgi:hypothetical protein